VLTYYISTDSHLQLAELREEQRPWVRFVNVPYVFIVSPLTFDNFGAKINLEFVVVNVGHLPARFTELKGDLSLSNGDVEQTNNSWKECDGSKTRIHGKAARAMRRKREVRI